VNDHIHLVMVVSTILRCTLVADEGRAYKLPACGLGTEWAAYKSELLFEIKRHGESPKRCIRGTCARIREGEGMAWLRRL
jgi:hypothetical protein